MQHLLNQKIGLFHHMSGHDIVPMSQMALKYCTTLSNVSQLVKESTPSEDNVNINNLVQTNLFLYCLE